MNPVGEVCSVCGKNKYLSVAGYICINPSCSEFREVKFGTFPVEVSTNSNNEWVGKTVFIKELKIYGEVVKTWKAKDSDNVMKDNLIIKDELNIEHEWWDYEVDVVDDLSTIAGKAKCILPLESLIEKFFEISNKYELKMEASIKKENAHSSNLVPFSFVRFTDGNDTLFIKNGEFFSAKEDYIPSADEYECCIWSYDTAIKDVVYELYLNIISRIKK